MEDAADSRGAGSGSPSGVTSVLAVSLGPAWLLELRDASGPTDFLLVPGGELDLFAPWSDEILASVGVRRQGHWEFASDTFGFVAVAASGSDR